mmetsp:Transcript_14662/g.34896  ORF Transcript_14662/g.34896 Transcript_14662/m.34896 type:complete len:332 (-) Transcript_14662:2312-3307(-)
MQGPCYSRQRHGGGRAHTGPNPGAPFRRRIAFGLCSCSRQDDGRRNAPAALLAPPALRHAPPPRQRRRRRRPPAGSPSQPKRNLRSASVRRPSAALSFPTVPSKMSCFFSCSLRIRSSIVPPMISLVTRIGRYCPRRWMRSCACCSTAGFHHGSIRITWLAAVRLSATPPALRLIRKHFTCGSSVNSLMYLSRCWMLMDPRSFTDRMPTWFRRKCTRSSMEVNWLKMMHLADGSLWSMSWISSRTASILVLLWKELLLMRSRIDERPLLTLTGAAEDFPLRSTVRGFLQAGQAAEDGAPSTKSAMQARQKTSPHAAASGSSGGSWQMAHVV